MAKQLNAREIDLILWCLDEQLDRFDLVEAAARFEPGRPPAHRAELERLRAKVERLRDREGAAQGRSPGSSR